MRTVVEMRENFEDWARNAVSQFSASGRHIRDDKWSYNHNIVNIMWQCWQQATAKTLANPDGPEAAALIEELLGLVDESLFHLRLDEAAKAYHERALAALAKAHHPEEVLK